MAAAVPATLLRFAFLIRFVQVISLQVEHEGVQPHGPRTLSAGDGARQRTGIVDLDQPAWSRWRDVVVANRHHMIQCFQAWSEILDSIPGLNKREWSDAVGKALPLEYFEEAYSIVKFLNHSETRDMDVLLFSAMYELGQTMQTVDVLAASAETGRVVHGHSVQKALMAPLIEVTFLRGGVPLYTAPMLLGSIGVTVAIRPEMWTFSHAGASSAADTPASILQRLQGSAQIPCIMVRQYLDGGLPFREAAGRLQAIPVARAQRFVLAGARPYQGLVISRTGDPGFRHTESLGPSKLYLFEAGDAPDLAVQAVANKIRSVSDGRGDREETRATTAVPTMVTTAMTSHELVHSAETLWTCIMAPTSGKLCTIYAPEVGERHCDWTNWDVPSAGLPEGRFRAAVRPRDDSTPFSAAVPARRGARPPPRAVSAARSEPIAQRVRSGTWRDYAGSPEYRRVPP